MKKAAKRDVAAMALKKTSYQPNPIPPHLREYYARRAAELSGELDDETTEDEEL